MTAKNDISAMQERIRKLKKEQDALLLVHNYQRPEIQDVADVIGDSFGLSQKAQIATQANIVFCGVDFMAESALILNPSKNVIHPNPESKCPMAAMVDPEGLKALMAQYPGVPVVAYVNTSAAVKALVDVCCTSSNAVKVIGSLPDKKVIFIPDSNLGLYVQRTVKDKEIILWPGYCRTHQKLSVKQLKALKKEHPNALVIVHPECVPEVIDFADAVASTEGMLAFVRKSDQKEFIIGTEREMVYRLRKEVPGKTFYQVDTAVCPAMKKITLKDVLKALETLEPKVRLPKDIMDKARAPLERMISIGRGEAAFVK
jgi:quinolinate synthase